MFLTSGMTDAFFTSFFSKYFKVMTCYWPYELWYHLLILKIKKFLIEVLEEELAPIRERRRYYEERIDEVYDILEAGCKKARTVASETLKRVRKAIGIEYFEDAELRKDYNDKYDMHIVFVYIYV